MNPNLPQIYGLTLNYRDARRTAACIDSLLAEGIDRILVWDNSEDGGVSATELRMMLASMDRVSIEISPSNLGFAAGVNRGVERITAKSPNALVLLINNDAKLLPGAVDQLADVLMQNKEALLSYPKINHGGRGLGTMYYQPLFALLSSKPMLGSFGYPSGCALLLAPSRFNRPVFDETFFMYGEDWLLGWHLYHKPPAMIHVAEVLVEHEGSASSGLGSEFYENRLVAAHLTLARKMARNRLDYTILLMGRLLMLPMRAILRSARYCSPIPIKALFTGWKLARINAKMTQAGK